MLRIGVNALYLIPGSVGGTEIYLRNLLRALAAIDSVNLSVSARCSRGIIAVSNATREDFLHYYGRDAQVIHHGVEREFFDIAKHREPRDYVLCASTSHPHKNLDRLLRVHRELKYPPPLIITGVRGFAAEEVERLAGKSVRLTGWIPRGE